MMISPMSNTNPLYPISPMMAKLHSCGVAIETALNVMTQKVKDFVISPLGQGIIGFGLGIGWEIGVNRIYDPFKQKIVKALGLLPSPLHSYSDLNLDAKIFLTPFICLIVPILDEVTFRWGFQEVFKDKFKSFYVNLGLSDSTAHLAARMTSLFFVSVIYGAICFSDAILFQYNPILLLPRVVAATMTGFMFGLAKEFSGNLSMPIGMHIGFNTLAGL